MTERNRPTPPAGPDGLGNDMSDRSTYTEESESGDTDTPIGNAGTGMDDAAVPLGTQEQDTAMHDTGTEFGSNPADDKSQ